MAVGNGNDLSWKEQKRQLKLQRKKDKLVRKRARKEGKLASKVVRQQQRGAVSYRTLMDRSQAATLIEELVTGLRAGKITVEHGDDQLTVEAPDTVDVRVRARQTWKTQGLTIRVRWPRSRVTNESEELKVSAS